MVEFNENISREIQDKIFDVSGRKPKKGNWWWWFWLLFFDNPANPEKPRQIMVLWSTKEDKVIECNDVELKLDMNLAKQTNGKERDGAVAAWYFDGEDMHHNYILEQTPIVFGKDRISTKKLKTGTGGCNDSYWVELPNMQFDLVLSEKNKFTMPEYHSRKHAGKYEYELLRMNKLNLNGVVEGKKVKGSAYFQRVLLNAPAIPWYWGIFHFENNAILTYFMPHLGVFLGKKSLKKDITFYYNGETHEIKNIKVCEIKGENPIFKISGENDNEKMSFEVHSYASSFWKFRKKLFGLGPKMTFTYNEYPATIKNFELLDKKTGKKILQSELGFAVGNAEKSVGFIA